MHLTIHQLSARLDEALYGASLHLVDLHLESCETCRSHLSVLAMQDEVLGRILTDKPSAEFLDSLLIESAKQIDSNRARKLALRLATRAEVMSRERAEEERKAGHAELRREAPPETRTEEAQEPETEAKPEPVTEAEALAMAEALAREIVVADEAANVLEAAEAFAAEGAVAQDASAPEVTEAEARAQAEEQARTESEAQEAAAQAEAEARAEAEEAAARAAIAAEARARVELEAHEAAMRAAAAEQERARAAAEEQAKIEAQAKARAEAERRARAETEARAKAEAEERARAEAEARAQAIAQREALLAQARAAAEAARSSAAAAGVARAEAEAKAAEAEAKAAEATQAVAEAERHAHEAARVGAESRPLTEARPPSAADAETQAATPEWVELSAEPKSSRPRPAPTPRRAPARRGRRSSGILVRVAAAVVVLLGAAIAWWAFEGGHRGEIARRAPGSIHAESATQTSPPGVAEEHVTSVRNPTTAKPAMVAPAKEEPAEGKPATTDAVETPVPSPQSKQAVPARNSSSTISHPALHRPTRSQRTAPATVDSSRASGHPARGAISATKTLSTKVAPVPTAAASRPRPSARESETPAVERGLLCGQVRDEDGKSIAGATVVLADVGIGILTDRTGHFCLTAPVGDRTLSVISMGFQTLRQLVSVSRRTPELNLTLRSMSAAPRDTSAH